MLAKQLQGAAKGVAVDSDFENVTLLLHGNGTNGAQNNTFTDGSSNAFSITRNGNTTQGTFSPYGDNWSNYFDGTGDYIENTSNYLVASTTSTFTIEAWVFMTADPVDDANDIPAMISVNCGGGNNSLNYMAFGPISSRKLRIRWFDGTAKNAEGSTTLALNTWYHVACSVSSNAIKMFVNGVEETLSGTTTLTNRNNDANGFALGQTFTYANYTGYISNARVLSGTALYTTGFTPSTAPLTAITNTVLLTCQSNRFRDASSNAYAITTAGNTSVQRFSPFSPTAAYASGTIGGSGYFDGTGDYLVTPSSSAFAFGTGDYTVEFWLYPLAIQDQRAIVDIGAATWQFYNNVSGQLLFYNGADRITSSAIVNNSWYHIAITRQSNTTKLFINGTQSGSSYTDTSNYSTNNAFAIADRTDGGLSELKAYISDVRVVKGTAVYTAAFTPPTSPVTAITNTSLLLNFTNAGIIDNAMMNDLETVGNAQISTTQSKFGGSSMYFDGTGDWLTAYNGNGLFVLGTVYTVEMWFYTTTIASGSAGLINFATTSGGTAGFSLGRDAAEIVCNDGVSGGTGPSSGASTVSVNTWTHLAVVSNGTTTKLYLDGVEKGSYTGTTGSAYSMTYLTIGSFNDKTIGAFSGYIDDLRITKGVARYTANFTAPTAPFADQ